MLKHDKPRGVHLAKSAADAAKSATQILANTLVTKQTGPAGKVVRRGLVEEGCDIQRELYLSILLDRAVGRVVIMASTEGGMDIEEVAARTPEKILKELIDPAVGMMSFQGRKLARALGLTGALIGQAAQLFQGVYQTFWDCDGSLVEINPLCRVTGRDGQPALPPPSVCSDSSRARPWPPSSGC